jgi:Tol biopolymer transport system component
VIRLLTRVVVVSILAAAPIDVGAQYFGRNKVEYIDFDFRILATAHFDVYYYAREERAARLAAQLAERWYSRLSTVLRHEFQHRQPLVFYGSQAEFSQTNVVSGLLPDSVGGVTESSKRRIVMPFAPTMAETNRVLGHEIVHAFQFDIARRHGGGTGQPLWFVEGMAEYLARGSLDSESSLWLRDAVLGERVPARQKDAAGDLSPYQFGHAFWSYLGQRFGDDILEKALKPDKKSRKTKDRMRYATGQELEALYADWRSSVVGAYSDRASIARLPRWARGSMQIGPALSPDGTQAVFFSERDRLSLDLFLADVNGGRIIRKLATTAASAEFESLQPLRSSGAWSPNGDRFAFAAVRQGRASLMLLDMRDGDRNREIAFTGLGQILSPTWSPDGHTIAFSALAGGFTDLYVYDLATGHLRQLTDDAFADLQPAWSHDGRSIAFVTERFSSDLRDLQFGRPRLAILDADAGTVRPVGAGAVAAHLSPQWSGDDRELYFVGDADGTTNVFRVGLQTSELHQVTNVATGVSGITPTSPVLSLAKNASVAGFTVYENGRPQLVILDDPAAILGDQVSGDPFDSRSGSPSANPTFAQGRPSGLVDRLLADQQTGLPAASSIAARPYASRLSLEGVGQPYISSGGGPLGTFVRGGGALVFGDMLGERRLGAAVQVGNRLHDTAFEFRFLNQERRWNWGAVAELEPGLRRYRRTSAIEHGGEAALLHQQDYLQRMQLRAAAVVAYPFSRGLRVEFSGGARHATYRSDIRSEIASAATGRVLATDRVELPGGRPTTVAEVAAALVHDTTIFGPTGALLGSRYRFEIAPTVGDLSYTRVLADYRRYLMPVRPYSVAVRVMHSGRYGRDGNDPRLLSSFLASSYLVRGHRSDLHYCHPDVTRSCGDELLGNRLLVANVEVRVPIWGILTRQIDYGPLPADAFVFADGGMVWSEPGRRSGISSLGGGIRVNAGGLPLELAAIRALDGPAPRWQFDIGFRVGF